MKSEFIELLVEASRDLWLVKTTLEARFLYLVLSLVFFNQPELSGPACFSPIFRREMAKLGGEREGG